MELLYPVKRIGNQVVAYLRSAVIIDQRSPMRMRPLSRVLVLIQACPVEPGQSVSISRKMGRNPVQNHADSCFVQLVDKIHKILRCAITCSRRIIADDLIAPGSIQRVLHNRHQLHMGIAHFLHIGNNLRCKLPVVIISAAILWLCKGAQIHFVNAHRLFFGTAIFPCQDPCFIFPGKAIDAANNRCRVRAELLSKRIGICLQVSQTAL